VSEILEKRLEKILLKKSKDGYRKSGTSSLMRVTGRVFRITELVSDFKEASRNFILEFLHKKQCYGTVSIYYGSGSYF
jgi:hypothetical protein